jgi:site-specific DNA recombinase
VEGKLTPRRAGQHPDESAQRGPVGAQGEIVGPGQWAPLVPEETWRVVCAILGDPTRKPPRGVRTLLGGIAQRPCGNITTGQPSHNGHPIYRCSFHDRNRDYPGTHVCRKARDVEHFIVQLVIGQLSRDDAADLIEMPEGGPDVPALREEAAAIRRNLDELAADRAVGLIARAQMLAATIRATARLDQIGAELEQAAKESVLAPLVAADNITAVWEDLDLSRKRAVIKTLMTITLLSPGRGARKPFDPGTVKVCWQQPV